METITKPKKKAKKQLVLEALQRGERITPLQALFNIGCFSLSQRVSELNKEGYGIDSVTVKHGTSYFSEYFIPKTTANVQN